MQQLYVNLSRWVHVFLKVEQLMLYQLVLCYTFIFGFMSVDFYDNKRTLVPYIFRIVFQKNFIKNVKKTIYKKS